MDDENKIINGKIPGEDNGDDDEEEMSLLEKRKKKRVYCLITLLLISVIGWISWIAVFLR
ncbi:MAG: hypothetical protein ACTSVI_00195 [Promethearchaeota archaeon]